MVFKCKICGGIFDINDDSTVVVCEYCGNKQRIEQEETYTSESNEKIIKTSGTVRKVLGILICTIIICIGSIVSFMLVRQSKKQPDVPVNQVHTNETTAQMTALAVSTETVTTPEVTKRIFVRDVEQKVSEIRNDYNKTQSLVSSLTVLQIDKYKYYYNSLKNYERVDFELNNSSYSACFYYNDSNELYFAFVFDGESENRFYIYDDTIFRWIDERGVIHDNDYESMEEYNWHEIIFNENKIILNYGR